MTSRDDLVSELDKTRYILAPEILLTPNGPVGDHALVVDEGLIADIIPLDQLDEGDGAIARSLPAQAIIPGFIDAHTHLGQTFGKALIGGEPAQIWRRIWIPMEDALDEEGVYASAKWQFLELLRGGYTGVVNYALNDAARNAVVHRAAAETGIRLVSAVGLNEKVEAEDGVRQLPLAALYEALDENIAQTAASDLLTSSGCLNSFYANEPETLAAISAHAAKRNVLLQIHANEHFPEVHECILRFGKRPIELLHAAGVLGPHVLIHHATLVTDQEIELLRRTGTGVSYNPIASQWKGNAVAPALAYAARGVRMGIGSDATRYDGFRALDAAENAQRIAHGLRVSDFSSGAAWTWVDALTRGSADVGGLGEATGTLARGKAADFLVLDIERPETLPSWDFEWELVRYYNRDQIAAVVVAGKPVLASGRAIGWDDRAFVAKYRDLSRRIGEAPGILRVHGPSTNYRVPGSRLRTR